MELINLSIMSMNADHIDEICQDIIYQQQNGISSIAMLMMYFAPEGTPAVEKAKISCKLFDEFATRLDKAGARYGVLVQSTMGHINPPATPHPFQNVVSTITGDEIKSTCCPLDQNFKDYMKEQMKELAKHNPEIIMLDDDIGLLYRGNTRGCSCPLHLAKVNERLGTNLTREQLLEKMQSGSEEGKRIEQVFARVQGDSLVEFVKYIRQGIDEVNPKLQGAVSGILGNYWMEFSSETAEAFRGQGNPKMIRLNGAVYCSESTHYMSIRMFRYQHLMHYAGKENTIFLAETDTCPHNRYSTSAIRLHAHYTACLLEGAQGAKHWLTRSAFEPKAGVAYRKILSKYSKFYQAVADLYPQIQFAGCRMPLFGKIDYGFSSKKKGVHPCPWASCVLERMGLPIYFSSEQGGAVFIDDYLPERLTKEEIEPIFKGTVVMTSKAARTLIEMGYGDYIGVDVQDWTGKPVNREVIDGVNEPKQLEVLQLIPNKQGVKELSFNYHIASGKEPEKLFPAVTGYKNSLGGYSVVFCGTPDSLFNYWSSFSMLNGLRKQQFIDILNQQDNLPVYYTEDVDMYLKAGRLKDGTIVCAMINTGLDELEDLPIKVNKPFTKIQKLNELGERVDCDFEIVDGVVRVKERTPSHLPQILFIS
ncbi:MAG: hypothetical protein II988_01890 [Clostridia bacterium]|nr:hypothetical protein [Clostridia bacterium]